jgi:uncharacterized protein YbcC (UPF0753/DUF2309 family)
MLNRDDYPGLTDEQWTALNAEIDRARTEASNTARTNARKGYIAESEAETRAQAALEKERERLAMDEAQRLEADRKALADQQAALAAQQRTFKAQKKLAEAGLPEDKVSSLLPLFAGVDDKALDTTLDTFITTHQESVKAQVDKEKVALMGGATPPAAPTTGQVDTNTVAQQQIESGDLVGAAASIFAAAGVLPQQ